MKGFDRSVKEAVYTGCKMALTAVGIGALLIVWFYIIGMYDRSLNALFARLPWFIVMYGALMLLVNNSFYAAVNIKYQLGMGCTRKHAGYGFSLMNLVYTVVTAGAAGLIMLFTQNGDLQYQLTDMCPVISVFLAIGGISALGGILVDKYGRIAYMTGMILICGVAGGLVGFINVFFEGDFGKTLSVFRSPVTLLVAAVIFLLGQFVFNCYNRKAEVRL